MTILYYSKTKKIYTNRLDAISAPEPCYLYFDDNVYMNVNWTSEPQETLKELYRQQAQRIRDKYKYIILAYSGGIDSTNMLESFYYNNIHIDEILVVGALSQDSEFGVDENHNGDLYHNVFPTLKKLNLPNTKINIQDYSTYFNDPNKFESIRKFKSDWIEDFPGAFFSPNNLFWIDTRSFTFHNNKNTALLFAIDKPCFRYDNVQKRMYTEFYDGNLKGYSNSYDGYERINFYWDSSFPKILIKQLWTIADFFKRKNFPDKIFYQYQTQFIESLIYPIHNPLVHKSKKSTTSILSVRDPFIIKNTSSDIYKIYKDGIINLQRRIPRTDIFRGMIPQFVSRRYYLD